MRVSGHAVRDMKRLSRRATDSLRTARSFSVHLETPFPFTDVNNRETNRKERKIEKNRTAQQ